MKIVKTDIDDFDEKIINEAKLYGFEVLGIIPSPIEGGDGNKEYLVAFTYKGKE